MQNYNYYQCHWRDTQNSIGNISEVSAIHFEYSFQVSPPDSTYKMSRMSNLELHCNMLHHLAGSQYLRSSKIHSHQKPVVHICLVFKKTGNIYFFHTEIINFFTHKIYENR